jgi:hypothetical protein
MTDTTLTATDQVRSLDDEAIDSLYPFAVSLGERDYLASLILREAARRAEIRMNRSMDVQYGGNRYGFTMDGIAAKHDASWYESRQTEDEFLAEMGVQA